MKSMMLLMIGLCVLSAGCMSQEQTGNSAGQNTVTPQQSSPNGQGPQRGPPQEAVDACAQKAANDTCEFTVSGRTTSGICVSRRGGQLTCFSSNMRFPQEAVDVCKDKSTNDTCEFTIGNRTIDGTCNPGMNQQMMCRPQGMGAERFQRNGTGYPGQRPPEDGVGNPGQQ